MQIILRKPPVPEIFREIVTIIVIIIQVIISICFKIVWICNIAMNPKYVV